MSEYIEREAAIENIKDTFLGASEFANDTRNAAINAVNSVSTADVQKVRYGKWECLEPEIGLYSCSECGHNILRAKCNFCPNCGAKMDKE